MHVRLDENFVPSKQQQEAEEGTCKKKKVENNYANKTLFGPLQKTIPFTINLTLLFCLLSLLESCQSFVCFVECQRGSSARRAQCSSLYERGALQAHSIPAVSVVIE